MPRFLRFGNSGPREKEPQSGPDLSESTWARTVQMFKDQQISIDELEERLTERRRSESTGEVQLRLKVNEELAQIWAGIINDLSSSNPQSPARVLDRAELLILGQVDSGRNENELRRFFIEDKEHGFSPGEAPRMVRTVLKLRKLTP